MAKLAKKSWPSGHGPDDFECFGPAAVKDGEFNDCRIADFGCFSQDGVDSNKFYHACVCKSKKDGKYWGYFEWGRVGRANPDFQFTGPFNTESDAVEAFVDQCHEKNTKRGVWSTIAGIQTLAPKPGKEGSLYLVRPQATRSTGLPDARRIVCNDGAKKPVPVATSTKDKLKKKACTIEIDEETRKLLRDFRVGVHFLHQVIDG